MRESSILLSVLVSVTLISGCSEPASHSRGIYLLLDTSGTYTKELDKAKNIINYSLSQLNPGDSFAVARIDTGSFSEKDIITKVTFDNRPSMANQQKRAFSETINNFTKTVQPSAYTDITGGVLQATEYLNETQAGTKTILIFSDLKEELGEGYIRDIPLKLDNYDVVALNVTKLRSDNFDPQEYMDRLDMWRQRVEQSGGTWRQINDLERLEGLLSDD